jgi:hypothetical protein
MSPHIISVGCHLRESVVNQFFLSSTVSSARRKKNLEADQSENGVLQVSDGETDIISNEKPFGVHMFPYPSATPSQSSLFLFDNISDVSNAVAMHVTGLSVQAIHSRGSFTLVLSGGSLVKVSFWVQGNCDKYTSTFLAATSKSPCFSLP